MIMKSELPIFFLSSSVTSLRPALQYLASLFLHNPISFPAGVIQTFPDKKGRGHACGSPDVCACGSTGMKKLGGDR